MNPISSYLSSLQSKKPAYGNLFSSPTANTSLQKPTVAPNMSVAPAQSAAPASTSPTPTVITPPVKTNTGSPAKSAYVATLAGSKTGTDTTGTQNPPAYSLPGYKSPGQIADEKAVADRTAGTTGATGGTTGSTASKTDPLASYRDYLAQYATSLKPSDEIAAASSKLADVQNKIDERSLKSRREYEAALKKEGGLQAGNEASARAIERQNASELADLGVAEGGAARTLEALTGVKKSESEAIKALLDMSKPMQLGDSYIDPVSGKTVYEKPKEGFNLTEGGSRYEYNTKTGKYEKVASAPKTTAATGTPIIGSNGSTYTPGVNPTVDSWANRVQNGSAKITDIPASQVGLRNAVSVALDAMGNSAEGKPTTTELGKAALTTAKTLMDKFGKGQGTSVVGGSRLFGGALAGVTPGTDAANFKNDFNSLKSQLSLEGVKYLKGQGQVSDAERALLASAVTKLNLSQSDDEFKTTLQGVIDRLEGNSTSSAGVLRSPDGAQEVSVSDLTPAELAEAKAAGWK